MLTTFSQILILGSSLGARLAALLLARQGRQVMHLCPTGAAVEGWESAPPLLIRFLDLFDARSCLRPAQTRACLTPQSRLELHGAFSLKDELQRELRDSAQSLIGLLDSLSETGEQLTDFFWETEGVPSTLRQRLCLPAQLLRHGLSNKKLMLPAADAGKQLSGIATELLETCISGHSLQPLSKLSHAEMALIWTELASTQDIAPSALNELLVNRLQNAGGTFQQFAPDTELELLPDESPGILLSGQQYLADQILVGSGIPANITHLPSLSGGYGRKVAVRFLAGSPAEILPNKIVSSLHAGEPLRAELTGEKKSPEAEITLPYRSSPLDNKELTGWLEQLFPFCKIQLADQIPGCQMPTLEGFPGRYQNFRLSGSQYWNVSGASLFPTLLNTGECLAAMTLAARLSA